MNKRQKLHKFKTYIIPVGLYQYKNIQFIILVCTYIHNECKNFIMSESNTLLCTISYII